MHAIYIYILNPKSFSTNNINHEKVLYLLLNLVLISSCGIGDWSQRYHIYEICVREKIYENKRKWTFIDSKTNKNHIEEAGQGKLRLKLKLSESYNIKQL